MSAAIKASLETEITNKSAREKQKHIELIDNNIIFACSSLNKGSTFVNHFNEINNVIETVISKITDKLAIFVDPYLNQSDVDESTLKNLKNNNYEIIDQKKLSLIQYLNMRLENKELEELEKEQVKGIVFTECNNLLDTFLEKQFWMYLLNDAETQVDFNQIEKINDVIVKMLIPNLITFYNSIQEGGFVLNFYTDPTNPGNIELVKIEESIAGSQYRLFIEHLAFAKMFNHLFLLIDNNGLYMKKLDEKFTKKSYKTFYALIIDRIKVLIKDILIENETRNAESDKAIFDIINKEFFNGKLRTDIQSINAVEDIMFCLEKNLKTHLYANDITYFEPVSSKQTKSQMPTRPTTAKQKISSLSFQRASNTGRRTKKNLPNPPSANSAALSLKLNNRSSSGAASVRLSPHAVLPRIKTKAEKAAELAAELAAAAEAELVRHSIEKYDNLARQAQEQEIAAAAAEALQKAKKKPSVDSSISNLSPEVRAQIEREAKKAENNRIARLKEESKFETPPDEEYIDPSIKYTGFNTGKQNDQCGDHYVEKQYNLYCAIHAMNNLLGEQIFIHNPTTEDIYTKNPKSGKIFINLNGYEKKKDKDIHVNKKTGDYGIESLEAINDEIEALNNMNYPDGEIPDGIPIYQYLNYDFKNLFTKTNKEKKQIIMEQIMDIIFNPNFLGFIIYTGHMKQPAHYYVIKKKNMDDPTLFMLIDSKSIVDGGMYPTCLSGDINDVIEHIKYIINNIKDTIFSELNFNLGVVFANPRIEIEHPKGNSYIPAIRSRSRSKSPGSRLSSPRGKSPSSRGKSPSRNGPSASFKAHPPSGSRVPHPPSGSRKSHVPHPPSGIRSSLTRKNLNPKKYICVMRHGVRLDSEMQDGVSLDLKDIQTIPQSLEIHKHIEELKRRDPEDILAKKLERIELWDEYFKDRQQRIFDVPLYLKPSYPIFRENMQKINLYMKGEKFDVIVTSPYRRCWQTAIDMGIDLGTNTEIINIYIDIDLSESEGEIYKGKQSIIDLKKNKRIDPKIQKELQNVKELPQYDASNTRKEIYDLLSEQEIRKEINDYMAEYIPAIKDIFKINFVQLKPDEYMNQRSKTFNDLEERIKNTLTKLQNETFKNQSILIVTHGDLINKVLPRLPDIPDIGMYVAEYGGFVINTKPVDNSAVINFEVDRTNKNSYNALSSLA